MFPIILISVDYGAILIAIIVVSLMILILYLALVTTSFFFMNIFKKKIKHGKEKINVILFQKYDSLMKFSSIFKDKIEKDSPLFIFSHNEELKKYSELNVDEFEDFYNYYESLLNYAKKVFISSEEDANFSYGKEILDNIEDLNTKFLEAIQLYNTNVIGFNYWRNLFSTKWLKNILFIKEIKTIK